MLPQVDTLSINAGRITRSYNRLWEGFVVATSGILLAGGFLWIVFTLIDLFSDEYHLNIAHALTAVWVLPFIFFAVGARGVVKHSINRYYDYSVDATRIYQGLNKDHKRLAKPVVEKIYALEKVSGTKGCVKRIDMLRELKSRENTQVSVDDSDLVSLDAYLNDDALQPIDRLRAV